MGLTIQAIDTNSEILKELKYDYVSYESLRLELLKDLNIPYEMCQYKPTMHLIKLFNLNKNKLENEDQEAFILLMQPLYIDQTLTNHTLKIILNYIDDTDFNRRPHGKEIYTFYNFLKYSVDHKCKWYFY